MERKVGILEKKWREEMKGSWRELLENEEMKRRREETD